jgi:hypothetical protein
MEKLKACDIEKRVSSNFLFLTPPPSYASPFPIFTSFSLQFRACGHHFSYSLANSLITLLHFILLSQLPIKTDFRGWESWVSGQPRLHRETLSQKKPKNGSGSDHLSTSLWDPQAAELQEELIQMHAWISPWDWSLRGSSFDWFLKTSVI